MTLEELHAILTTAYGAVVSLYGRLPDGVSADTAFSIGEAGGVLSKAKALVGRDIDDQRKEDKA